MTSTGVEAMDTSKHDGAPPLPENADITSNAATQAKFEACHKTLNTTELLEMILLEVEDLGALLLSQRVSKMFQATIAGSEKLQIKLWFKEGSHSNSIEHRSDVAINPLFRRAHEEHVFLAPPFQQGVDEIRTTWSTKYAVGPESWRRMLLMKDVSADADFAYLKDVGPGGMPVFQKVIFFNCGMSADKLMANLREKGGILSDGGQ